VEEAITLESISMETDSEVENKFKAIRLRLKKKIIW
jgi:hypothetical protein